LAATRPETVKVRVLTERTAELEWLFELTGKLKGCTDERHVVEELLRAANERLNSGLTVLCVPEKMYGRLAEDPESANGSALYFDIDRMDLVNELHGFELGNEVIARVAELLTAPAMPAEALTARLSGDGFAVVLPDIEPDTAAELAVKVQTAVNKLAIGPTDSNASRPFRTTVFPAATRS
jgi:GGDEF domain-containing protein